MKVAIIISIVILTITQCNSSKTVSITKEQETSNTNGTLPTWHIYVLGKPSMQYWEAKLSVAKKWGINIQLEFGGCLINEDTDSKREKIRLENVTTFALYEKRFGKDWKAIFDKECDELLAQETKTSH